MASIYTVDQTLQVKDYYAKVIQSKTYNNIIQTLLKRGDKPEQWKQQIEVEETAEGYSAGAPEGADFDESTIAKRVNPQLEVQLEYFRTRRGFKVTDLAELLPGYTEKKGLKQLARQTQKDAQELVRSIELTLGSAQEAVERGTSEDTVAKTRGMLSWLLQGGEHSVQPIPAAFRPKCGITGDITSASVFNEALLREQLMAAALESGDGHLQLVALVGLKLKALMSNWLGKADLVQGSENILRRTEPKSRKIELICDEFAYDSVSFKALTCNHLGCEIGNPGTKIEIGTKQYYTGAFIRPEFWSIDTLLPLRIRKLENRGGGDRGFHETALRLACRNPLSQFAVVHTPSQAAG